MKQYQKGTLRLVRGKGKWATSNLVARAISSRTWVQMISKRYYEYNYYWSSNLMILISTVPRGAGLAGVRRCQFSLSSGCQVFERVQIAQKIQTSKGLTYKSQLNLPMTKFLRAPLIANYVKKSNLSKCLCKLGIFLAALIFLQTIFDCWKNSFQEVY